MSDDMVLARGLARSRWWKGAVLLAAAVWVHPGSRSAAQGPRDAGAAEAGGDRQTVLGPGLYVFQTRTRDASCGDSEPDGYVLSFFAAIHGIPHGASMTMELVNTPHFKEWSLDVVDNQRVLGKSRIGAAPDGPESVFEMKLAGDRFKGTGHRSYNSSVGGKKQRCRVNFDVLLRRLDG